MRRSSKLLPALALALVALAGVAEAQDYPARSVRFVVPYPAGGTTDILARIVGQYLSEHLGQQFVIDNRGGGGNNIGTEIVANAAPDGYTMLLVNPANGINTTLYTTPVIYLLLDRLHRRLRGSPRPAPYAAPTGAPAE